jgi:peptide/nickel transport system ATP-binding protein
MDSNKLLLSVKNLKTFFFSMEGTLKAINGVNFTVHEGETIGIVGESGCGKSVTSQSILRIVPRNGRIVGGEILYYRDGTVIDLTKMDDRGKEIRAIRGKEISMVFQEPMTSFSPVYTVGNQIMEVIKLHQGGTASEVRGKAIEILRRVEMPNPEKQIDSYSFNLSGGMRQRAMIAMALACSPRLLIADEPTSALDVTIQSQILELLVDLQKELGMAVMMITHDLGVVAQLADNVLIMYLGKNVEYGEVDAIYHNSKHPYTIGLLNSIPKLGIEENEELEPIKGSVPSLYNMPAGCPFHPRCPEFIAGLCEKEEPASVEIEPGHFVQCHLYSRDMGGQN